MEEEVTPVRLTKKGKPDKRSITSKQNINKAQSKVKEIVTKAKQKAVAPLPEIIDDSSECESDSEYVVQKVKPTPPTRKTSAPPPVVDSTISNQIDHLSKALEEIRSENQLLKQSFTQSSHLNKINSMTRQMLMKF